jgi:hypothetical protein
VHVRRYPRSGTHFIAQIVALLIGHAHAVDDLDGAVPYAEKCVSLGFRLDTSDASVVAGGTSLDRRCYYTHAHPEDWPFLDPPHATRTIFVVRNPKDVASSFFAFLSQMPAHAGKWPTLDAFVDDFLDRPEKVVAGSWLKHTLKWHDMANRPVARGKVLWLRFEEVKRDTAASIRKIANFLNVELTADLLKRTIELSSFESMKERVSKQTTHLQHFSSKGAGGLAGQVAFFRSGEIGSLVVEAPQCAARFEAQWSQPLKGAGIASVMDAS